MAEQSLGNRTRKTKAKAPKYTNINDIPVSEIINMKCNDLNTPDEDNAKIVEQNNKKTIIELDQVADLLGANSASGYYDIEFPSIGKSYQFKQLTVGQQRALSKNSIESENRTELLITRSAILKELCLDKTFEPTQINFAEFVNALITIRNNNFIDDLTFNIKCDNDKCGTHSYPFSIDLSKTQEDLEKLIKEKYNNTMPAYEFTVNGNTVKFNLDFPKMSSYIELSKFYETTTDEKLVNDTAIFVYPYISQILINDNEVNLSSIKDNIIKFKEFIDNTFIGMNFHNFVSVINNNFSEITNTIFTHTVKCPSCGTEKELTLELDDFFEL
jgi:hypothetical protein